MNRGFSYRTHILIGVRQDGVITVIANWPHVPKQADVQKAIEAARDGYATFALCTPTSVLPARNSEAASRSHGGRRRVS
jgi:hypothetical protein